MGQLRLCFQPVLPFEGLWSYRDIEESKSFEDLIDVYSYRNIRVP